MKFIRVTLLFLTTDLKFEVAANDIVILIFSNERITAKPD
jgi:hypothetical protein